jgi:hypothetical protein
MTRDCGFARLRRPENTLGEAMLNACKALELWAEAVMRRGQKIP